MGTGCTGGSDSGAPTPPADSGTTAPTDSGGGGQTTGG